MCDTLFAAAEITRDKYSLFAKNSDRPPNEAQNLAWFPSQTYRNKGNLSCTYIDIPQVEETSAVLLSKPYWMWGAEMGLNEHGVVIGNEAVFTKISANKEPALLGMDLLRLGLERGTTALEALEVITDLLEEFGQGGNCVENGQLYYQNSFLITDPNECWVLETVDRHWAARKVSPFYSISNLLSLEKSWDLCSDGLHNFLREKGLTKSTENINFTKDLSDFIFTTFSDGGSRCNRSRELLAQYQGKITIQTMASILRDHHDKSDPTPGVAGADICMHAGLGPIRISQTTGSMIVLVEGNSPLAFVTGTSAPCTGIFKPVWVDTIPALPGFDPGGVYDPETIFWSHERLHRDVITNYPEKIAAYRSSRDALEEEFITGALQLQDKGAEERKAYSEECFQKASAAAEQWLAKVKKIPSKRSLIHSTAWRGFNRNVGF
jgi:secernin